MRQQKSVARATRHDAQMRKCVETTRGERSRVHSHFAEESFDFARNNFHDEMGNCDALSASTSLVRNYASIWLQVIHVRAREKSKTFWPAASLSYAFPGKLCVTICVIPSSFTVDTKRTRKNPKSLYDLRAMCTANDHPTTVYKCLSTGFKTLGST